MLRDGERHAPAGHDDRPQTPAAFSRPNLADGVPATTVVAAMQELPSEQRELIIQTFYGGASVEEVAADRGVPVAKIKSDLFFAMRALCGVLDKQVTERHGVQ